MSIDKDKIVTQEETGEDAPMDEVQERIDATMKRMEGRAKEAVAQGMQDEEKECEGRELKEEGKRELEEQRDKQSSEEM